MGKALAKQLSPPFVLYLDGPLGAGKTALAQFIIQSLGFQGKVKSPSYSLVEVYPFSRLYLYHFDFYRFHSPFEFEEAGFNEYFHNQSICLVEWHQKATGFVPPADLLCALQTQKDGARRARCVAESVKGQECLTKTILSLADSSFNPP